MAQQADGFLLILDLDETLIHATEGKLSEQECFQCFDFFVYKRPHLETFLSFVFEAFSVAIWTSAGDEYANCILEQITPSGCSFEFVWTSNRCTQCFDGETRQTYLIKDLHKVKRRGYDLSRVLAVDDTPQYYERSYGNVLPMPPFLGNGEDRHLLKLIPYLQWLSTQADMRRIDKRGWQNHFVK